MQKGNFPQVSSWFYSFIHLELCYVNEIIACVGSNLNKMQGQKELVVDGSLYKCKHDINGVKNRKFV